ncbi:MAG TPA: DNA polymerase I, partial [Candidatus Wirthbacteria bacterium]|nr:DNA polymerase I [Candidatus Wirthbacteria bacterium]
MAKDSILLVDGNSLAHRAFHAFPELTSPDGQRVNAVYGFTLILLNALKKFSPGYMAVAFDLPAPTFRHLEYSEYKANRPETDRDLVEQFGLIKEVVKAFNIPIYEVEGFEADDVLGSLARGFANLDENLEIIIASSDRDIFQLINDQVSVYTSGRRMTDELVVEPIAFKIRYGFSPKQLVDYKALVGDSSDNIPGVKGIGEKTATKLIKEFSSLETIYDWLDNADSDDK